MTGGSVEQTGIILVALLSAAVAVHSFLRARRIVAEEKRLFASRTALDATPIEVAPREASTK
jgi:hypothetical protein